MFVSPPKTLAALNYSVKTRVWASVIHPVLSFTTPEKAENYEGRGGSRGVRHGSYGGVHNIGQAGGVQRVEACKALRQRPSQAEGQRAGRTDGIGTGFTVVRLLRCQKHSGAVLGWVVQVEPGLKALGFIISAREGNT